MLIFKRGVRASGLKEEMLVALDVATDVFSRLEKDCIVTSARGDKHGDHSHHYKGHAVDLRRKHLDSDQQAKILLIDLENDLGPGYQVVLESDHFHIEYDPRSVDLMWRYKTTRSA